MQTRADFNADALREPGTDTALGRERKVGQLGALDVGSGTRVPVASAEQEGSLRLVRAVDAGGSGARDWRVHVRRQRGRVRVRCRGEACSWALPRE